jgi:signal transduction histidine kinase
MSRSRSLGTWLALALLIAIAAPTAAAAGAWLAAGAWQAGREDARRAAAEQLLGGGALDTAAQRAALSERLTRLGVEAELAPNPRIVDKDAFAAKTREVYESGMSTPLTTPGFAAILKSPDGKQRLSTDFRAVSVSVPGAAGTLFVPRESASARWAVTLGAAVAALVAALVLAVSLLRRWVLRPLAQLAADAGRIAGGELAVEPVATRAREVAQVADALGGMAAALDTALGATAATERDRRFLVTAIAHDLRTPLFTLRGSLEAIERGIGDGDALARAQAKAAHLDRLVSDLFAYARAEYARDGHGYAPADLAEIARRAADTVDPGAIRLDVVTNGPVAIRGDPVALQRVLTNLLDNALRHARTRVKLTVTGRSVEVVDDGPGFPPADLPHVFEPLFRGDRARTTAGAGLGLAIARRLVRAHGGDVEAVNGATGARVTMTLPRSPS